VIDPENSKETDATPLSKQILAARRELARHVNQSRPMPVSET
jgi:hypothetical protein